jgi:ubiquinone/menaquinone biosynthesis C-methylase UbiE
MAELDANIRRYYDRGEEIQRFKVGDAAGALEFERTKEILLRYLPPPPLQILDVGGGPGVYAAWLADCGHQVHLVDPIPLHVEQARSAHAGIRTEVGDARSLTQDDASVDAVLLMGPLYHLVDRSDRMRALQESRRVLRPGGWLFAAAIGRYAALLDLFIRLGRMYESEVFRLVRECVADGVFRPSEKSPFTTAYFHLPSELQEEISAAGFKVSSVLNVEGPGFLLQDFQASWSDPSRRQTILEVARLLEDKPEFLAASGHLLAVARK